LEEIWDPAGALVGGHDHNPGRHSGKSCAPNAPEAQGVGGLQVWGSRHICCCDQGTSWQWQMMRTRCSRGARYE
jgi:hypothetical protein